jgi:hypothetical protein
VVAVLAVLDTPAVHGESAVPVAVATALTIVLVLRMEPPTQVAVVEVANTIVALVRVVRVS